MTIAAAVKVGRKLATGDFGYGQDDRKSAWADNGKTGVAGLREPGDTDCSFGTALCLALGELVPIDVLRRTLYSGNFGSALAAGGTVDRINVRKLSLGQINAKARKADAIYGPGHVMFCLGGGKWLSFEHTERGGSTGGRRGRQKGEGVRVRALYLRGAASRRAGNSKTGWTELVRAKSAATFLGQILAGYAKGESTAVAQARLDLRAPWDGPRYAEFVAEWAKLDKGAVLTYDATELEVPQAGHTFVILGGTRPQMRHRVDVALPAILANPGSKVIVTGAPVRGGVTEAQYMRARLVAAGVDTARIVVEDKAGSTIGNAIYSVALLRKMGSASYTLCSYSSHLRRASILFRAALAKAD
ncbi:MAG: hypothetical protein DI570_28775, partial [Phenylobacterium zucineum]